MILPPLMRAILGAASLVLFSAASDLSSFDNDEVTGYRIQNYRSPVNRLVEHGRRGIEQTGRWLDALETQLQTGFARGLDMSELMAEPMPDWTTGIAVARYEYARSVMHLLPALERNLLPRLAPV